jgi:hypothetical protein
MKGLLKLTSAKDNSTILIGAENIIEAKKMYHQGLKIEVTEIRSVGAMVITNWVTESVEEIHDQYKG